MSTKQSNGTYAVNLKNYVSDISRLSSVSGTYNSKTGITIFSYEPSSVTYNYNTKDYTITITAPSISGTLKAGTVSKSYSGTLKASGGTASYTWTVSKGNLPTGLTLNKSKGTITGTPKKAGKYSFTVKITDKNKATATKTYTLTIGEAANTSSHHQRHH